MPRIAIRNNENPDTTFTIFSRAIERDEYDQWGALWLQITGRLSLNLALTHEEALLLARALHFAATTSMAGFNVAEEND